MAFVPFDGAAECRIRMSLDGEPVETGFGLVAVGTVGITALETAVVTIGNYWATFIMPQLSTVTVLRSVYAFDLTSPTSYDAEWLDASLTEGTFGGEPLPNQNSAPFVLNTPFRGRSFRGRMSLPGLTNDSCDTNIINVGWLEDTLTMLNLLLLEITNETAYAMAVLSRVSEGVERSEGVATAVRSVTYRRVGPGSQDTRSKG